MYTIFCDIPDITGLTYREVKHKAVTNRLPNGNHTSLPRNAAKFLLDLSILFYVHLACVDACPPHACFVPGKVRKGH